MNLKDEHKALNTCLSLIEKKLEWGSSSEWHNDMFLELSEIIQQKTGILLSPTTLKRVWGRVHYESSPSISTLNTLAQFIDYKNWRDFKLNANISKPSFFEKKVVPYLSIIVPSAAVLTLVFISLFSMTNLSNADTEKDFSNVVFKSQPVTEGLPNSVVFNFDLDGIESDSIYIQQFWDKTKTIKLYKGQTQATGIYYFPGYFRSKLLVEGKIIKEHDLFIKSNGWSGTLDYDPVPKYFTNKDIFSDQKLSFPKIAFDEITNLKEPIISSFHLIQDFNASGDNISITSKVKSLYSDKWAVCQTLRVVILGSKGAMIIPFTQKGCISDISLLLNDVYLNGKKHDLSNFGVDLSYFRDIAIRVKGKNVTIEVDKELIYSGNYNESIGRFVGIRYRFLGAGEVENLSILNLENNKEIISQGL